MMRFIHEFSWKTRTSGCKASLVGVPLLFLLFSSCIPDPLEVKDVPVVKPEIVVGTQVFSDQSMVILLTRTFGALEASDDSDPEELLNQIAVNDATVTISGSNGTDTLLFLENGFYGGVEFSFKAGESYTLEVNSRELGKVRATSTVLPQVLFKDVQAELYYNENNDTLAQISYSFKDSTDANWYIVNVQEVDWESLSEDILNPRSFTRLLEDSDFDGEPYSEQFRIFPRDYAPGDTIAVSLSNISQAYYDFIKLRIDNRYSFIEFLGEPVDYPSNVEGGRGFFNLHIPDVRTVVLE